MHVCGAITVSISIRVLNGTSPEYVQAVWQNFDFSHIGFASLEELTTEEVNWR
jgi:hypothetical protein